MDKDRLIQQGFLVGAGATVVVAAVLINLLLDKKRDLHMVCEYVLGGPLQHVDYEENPKTQKQAIVAACSTELGLVQVPDER